MENVSIFAHAIVRADFVYTQVIATVFSLSTFIDIWKIRKLLKYDSTCTSDLIFKLQFYALYRYFLQTLKANKKSVSSEFFCNLTSLLKNHLASTLLKNQTLLGRCRILEVLKTVFLNDCTGIGFPYIISKARDFIIKLLKQITFPIAVINIHGNLYAIAYPVM